MVTRCYLGKNKSGVWAPVWRHTDLSSEHRLHSKQATRMLLTRAAAGRWDSENCPPQGPTQGEQILFMLPLARLAPGEFQHSCLLLINLYPFSLPRGGLVAASTVGGHCGTPPPFAHNSPHRRRRAARAQTRAEKNYTCTVISLP
jgi:hypothetical protein